MPALFTKLSALAVGGAVGSILRYALSGAAYRMLGTSFPWGTLVVNALGCFAIGLLWGLAERYPLRPTVNVLVFSGVIGAFTTFSTFGLETINLLREGEITYAAANVLLSNVVGLLLVIAGFALAQVIPTMLGFRGAS